MFLRRAAAPVRRQRSLMIDTQAEQPANARIVVALTGASGSVLGIRLIEELLNLRTPVTAVVSKSAWKVLGYEMDLCGTPPLSLSAVLEERQRTGAQEYLREAGDRDIDAPEASGTTPFAAIVIIPCSMKTLSAVAHGYADGLIARAADVALKERRRCILVPRETPLNLIHVENMRRALQAGAEIVPPIPAFYTQARSIDDAVDFITGKILRLLGKPHRLFPDWETQVRPSPI